MCGHENNRSIPLTPDGVIDFYKTVIIVSDLLKLTFKIEVVLVRQTKNVSMPA